MNCNVNVGLIKPGGQRIGGSVSPHGGSYSNLPRISPQLNPGWWCAARTMTSEQERTRKTSHDWNKNDVLGRAGSIPFHPNILDAFWFWFDKVCLFVDLFLHAMPFFAGFNVKSSPRTAVPKHGIYLQGLAVLSPLTEEKIQQVAQETGSGAPCIGKGSPKSRSLNSTYTGVHMSTYTKHDKTLYSVHIWKSHTFLNTNKQWKIMINIMICFESIMYIPKNRPVVAVKGCRSSCRSLASGLQAAVRPAILLGISSIKKGTYEPHT